MTNRQKIAQDSPKVVPFKSTPNLSEINSSDKEEENTEYQHLVIPAFIVGQLIISDNSLDYRAIICHYKFNS